MRIYLDHAATTPLAPEARAAMEPWLSPTANPSSLHAEGRAARQAIDQAREAVATAFGCLFGEVVFTSCGTEAANLAVIGTALASEDPGRKRILIGAAEHHCVLHARPLLARLGFRTELVPVDRIGRVRPEALARLLGDDVLLVSVMHANNELGTLNDVPSLSALARAHGALFHCDAVQTFPTPATVDDLGVDMVSVSGHKVYGPKGAGALYVKAGTALSPVMVGGGQERDLRAGTEDVAAIVGFAAAVDVCRRSSDSDAVKRRARDAFALDLIGAGAVPTVRTFQDDALPGHFHCRFPSVGAETLLIKLDRAGISASSGAACSSGSLEASHVLLACGYDEREAREGLRFTFGRGSTIDEAGYAARTVAAAAQSVMEIRL
ncbi:MAG: cysteine desulfurase [Armatimonadetes bacterium]|nr:cysteine desulfurase [Armatimonadota bacterium]